jgi:TPP-dependent pyruvate/acetoin dehydrogenase alpha subunit
MHIVAPAEGFLGTNGIVGDSAGLAVGAALKLQGEAGDRIAVAIIGDGAMGTGIVYESLNLAKLWGLPVVFVCENNRYAEMTPTSVHLSTEPARRAEAFGLWTQRVSGSDVEAVVEAVRQGVDAARLGTPAFVEVATHRWGGHYVGDPTLYRPEGEDERWRREHCPIRRLGERIGVQADLEREQEGLEQRARELVEGILSHDHSDNPSTVKGEGGTNRAR